MTTNTNQPTPNKANDRKQAAFINWFDTFLDEKEIGYECWDLTDKNGEFHIIDSEVVVEAILNAPLHEQLKIQTMLVKIDFVNGSVLDYFKHLANALINNR